MKDDELLPTPAEVRKSQEPLTKDEKAALKRLGDALRCMTGTTLSLDVDHLRGCRIERVVEELKKRGWRVDRHLDQRDGDYLEVSG